MQNDEQSFRIKWDNGDPYQEILNNFFFEQFPSNVTPSQDSLLDNVVNELIGTGQQRYGPKPNPESLVVIRDIVRKNIADGSPIPLLSSWGGVKADSESSIDIGEVAALKTISCLNRRVKKYYSPGIDVNIRIEDTGALWLFRRQENMPASVKQYTDDFTKLTSIMDYQFINAFGESNLMNLQSYINLSSDYSNIFHQYITQTDRVGRLDSNLDSFQMLKVAGWGGDVNFENRNYYRDRYRSLYPNNSDTYYTILLSEYLGGILARYNMNGLGENKNWKHKYLKFSFVPAVPGSPFNFVSNYLYYRTIPQRYTRDHITAWRGKGYLRIKDNQAFPAMASWRQENDYNPYSVVFAKGDESVSVQADYVIYD